MWIFHILYRKKIGNHYLLLMAEGGSDYNHAVTALTAKSLWGPYVPCTINPVLTHRHLGKDYPVQSLGHADLVQTPTGDWYAVFLGKRIVEGGLVPLGRETFLCEVSFQNGEPIFNPGIGVIGNRLKRPLLPWTPVSKTDKQNDFESSALSPEWATMRIPEQPFHHFADGNLFLSLRPEMADSLVCPSMLLHRVHSHNFSAITTMTFSTCQANEWAGLVLYRTAKGYYSLLKGKNEIRLTIDK
ncbi:family 43 glycosylhydrolase [uncultured Phocaeicola sp.]|uniref:family 43 glycosylhydrolase n=1 Tax=uncultured Phocaeicola sp. TaxID=990718 RepID=UPI0025966E7B|nr:family 43 glycosylhydrolase [uncultured Phocaeicola sp.]